MLKRQWRDLQNKGALPAHIAIFYKFSTVYWPFHPLHFSQIKQAAQQRTASPEGLPTGPSQPDAGKAALKIWAGGCLP